MARVAAPSLAATSASTKCPMPRVSFPAFRARSWAVTTTAGFLVEPAEPLARVQEGCVGLSPPDKALLRGLLAHPHAAADLGPGRCGSACLVDEVTDERVGDVVQVFCQLYGAGHAIKRVLVRAGDGADEVVAANRRDGRCRYAVNDIH